MLEHFLVMMIAILLGTKLAGHLCNRIGVPSVIGELLVGIILGPALLNIVQPTEIVQLFAQIGVILLMFLAGLESDLSQLKKYLKPSVLVAILGILFPMVLGSLVGHLFALPVVSSIFLGIVFSATSVSISVQVLREYNRLDSDEGSVILGAAVVDDIVVVLIVSVFSSIINMGSQLQFDFAFFWNLLGLKFLFFLVIYLFAKFLLQPVMRLASRVVAIESQAAMALVLCFAFAILSEKMGMSDVIGAFFIGLMMSTHPSQPKVQEKLDTIGYAFFIPIFFVSIGLNVEFSAFKEHFGMIVLLTLTGILSKLVGGYLGSRMSHLSKSASTIVGSGMVSRGEMALIIVQIGQAHHLVTGSVYSAIVVAIILTTLASPLLIKYSIEKLGKN